MTDIIKDPYINDLMARIREYTRSSYKHTQRYFEALLSYIIPLNIRIFKNMQPYLSPYTARLPVSAMYTHYSNAPLFDFSSNSTSSNGGGNRNGNGGGNGTGGSKSNSNYTITLPHYILLKIPTFDYTPLGGVPYALEKYHYIAIVMPQNGLLESDNHAEAITRLVTAHIHKVAQEENAKIDAITIVIFANRAGTITANAAATTTTANANANANNSNSNGNNSTSNSTKKQKKSKLIMGGRGSLFIFIGNNLHDQVNKFAYVLTNFYAAKAAGLLMSLPTKYNSKKSLMNKRALKTYLVAKSSSLVSYLLNHGTPFLDLDDGFGFEVANTSDGVRNLLARLLIACSAFASVFKDTTNIIKESNERILDHIIAKLKSRTLKTSTKASIYVNRRYLGHIIQLPRLLNDLISSSFSSFSSSAL